MIDETDVDARARLRDEEVKTDTLRAREATLSVAERLLRDEIRELRGELAGIRTRLDSLVVIEKELAYQGQRLSAIEKRFATLVETKLDGPRYPRVALAPAQPTAKEIT